MKFARRLALLVGGAALTLAPAAAYAQVTSIELTNAGTWRACADGHFEYGFCGFEFWDSAPTPNISDSFWNNSNPTAPVARLDVAPIFLSVGTNTLNFYQDYFGPDAFMGLALEFDNSATAQIGGWNSVNTTGVNAFSGVVATLFNPLGPSSFAIDGYDVTLTGFQYAYEGDDRVSQFDSPTPDDQADWRGSVTLDVETATPEPTSIVLFATGLIGVVLVRRRRAA